MKIADIAGAVLKGVAEIPLDLYYGTRRTFEDLGFRGAEVQKANNEERERIRALIKDAIRNRHVLERLIRIVIDDTFEKLPHETQQKIVERMQLGGIKTTSKQGAKVVLSGYLGSKLAAAITVKVIAQRLTKLGVGFAVSALILQGFLERASNASQRLAQANPTLHRKLKSQNLDMLYFLAEAELAPFVSLNVTQLRHPAVFDDFVRQLDRQLDAR